MDRGSQLSKDDEDDEDDEEDEEEEERRTRQEEEEEEEEKATDIKSNNPHLAGGEIFTYIIPANPCQCRFSNFVCKTWCFHAFPKPFRIEDIHIYYSCPPLPVQILQFRVQNLVFARLPKAISNRRYSHILFRPTPASADSPISRAKLGVFMPSQSHFK